MPARTILIVTPARELAKHLAKTVEKAGYGTRTSSSRRDALRQAASGIDCALIDWDLGGEPGSSLLTDLDARGHCFPKIIMANPGKFRTAVTAMKGGAADVLEKPLSPDVVQPAIDEAIARGAWTMRLSEDIRRARQVLAGLSEREQQVVAGIVSGLTSKEIAQSAAVSTRTIETSRTRLLGKLGVANTASLVRLVVLAGLPVMGPPPEALYA